MLDNLVSSRQRTKLTEPLLHILSMFFDIHMMYVPLGENQVMFWKKMSWLLFVFQTIRSPGTPTLYLGVAYKPNLLLLAFAETRCRFSLRGGRGPALGCVVLFSPHFYLSVCSASSLCWQTFRRGNWCVVFSQVLMKGVSHASLCSTLTSTKDEQRCGGFAPDIAVWASPWVWGGGLEAVWGDFWIQHLFLNSVCWEYS